MNENYSIISTEDICRYASRYEDSSKFITLPEPGDIFAIFIRPTYANTPYNFSGYGIVKKYVIDEQSKPAGKWVTMYFDSLSSFPPQEDCTFTVQPPHLALGTWNNSDRSMVFRIVTDFPALEDSEPKVPEKDSEKPVEEIEKEVIKKDHIENIDYNILEFSFKKD